MYIKYFLSSANTQTLHLTYALNLHIGTTKTYLDNVSYSAEDNFVYLENNM